jgi:hypothetical protein
MCLADQCRQLQSNYCVSVELAYGSRTGSDGHMHDTQILPYTLSSTSCYNAEQTSVTVQKLSLHATHYHAQHDKPSATEHDSHNINLD